MIEYIAGAIVIGLAAAVIIAAFAWYRIVPPTEAHLVVTANERFVVSPDEKVAEGGRKTYFAFPSMIPFIGRVVRVLDVTIKELVVEQETYEKGQARYSVKSSTKYKITNVKKAAETFINDNSLKAMLEEIIRASVRAVTVKYNVIDARAEKEKMSEEIEKVMTPDLDGWGLTLVNFQLVDFQDTEDSKIISDISRRREVDIQSTTRQENAEKQKQARVKEAEAEETASKREIEKDKVIAEEQQMKTQAIAEKEKLAKEIAYEVIQVETIRQAEIDKEKAIVRANQDKETEKINKQKKQLEGEGDRLLAQERAIGEAAPIRAKGLAEAEAKDKLQAALNKFQPEAIRALVAEQVVQKDRDIGMAGAKALEKADVKLFAGDGAKEGFDIGKLISAVRISDEDTADAILHRTAKPNDLGMTTGLAIGKETLKEESKNKLIKK